MTALPAIAGLAAAAAGYAAAHGVIRLARARGWLCPPDEDRRIHQRPVPRLGGVAVIIGATTGLAAALVAQPSALTAGLQRPPGPLLAGLLLGGGIAFAAGLVDDVRGLRPRTKLLAQVAAALVAYGLGFGIQHLSWGGGAVALGWLSLPVTVLWIVGVTNAYNLVDGMDGLAAGLGVIAFGAIAAAAAALGHGGVVVVAAVMLGALAGFLPHNFSPARIFLGDSGSLFVGFVLAVLSVQGSMKSATAVIVAVPLFALFIPLLDTAVAMARRWLRGTPIARADARHIHHRLVDTGLSHRDAVLVLYLVGAGFAGLGILLGFAPPRQLAVIALLAALASAAVLVVGMRRLGYDEFLLTGKVLASGPRRVRQVLRDRLRAMELAEAVARARSLDEVQGLLDDAAPELGLVRMEVCAAGAPGGNGASHGAVDVWHLEFPVAGTGDATDPHVLRLAAHVQNRDRPETAERVAHIVGDALRGRLPALRVTERLDGPRMREKDRDAAGLSTLAKA